MSPHSFIHWYLSGTSEFFYFKEGYYYSVYSTNFEQFRRVTSLKMLPWDGKQEENKKVAKWKLCRSVDTFFYNSSFHLLRKVCTLIYPKNPQQKILYWWYNYLFVFPLFSPPWQHVQAGDPAKLVRISSRQWVVMPFHKI
jgi:hypothetical protein